MAISWLLNSLGSPDCREPGDLSFINNKPRDLGPVTFILQASASHKWVHHGNPWVLRVVVKAC